MSFSTLSDNYSLIQRNTNDFSFVGELINATNNYDFKKDADVVLTGGIDNERSYIWTALSNIVGNQLSNIHEDIQQQLEDNILNFIDNVTNIDLCKVKSLQSMMTMFGINYSIFDKLKLMPLQLIKLIDILSIKKEYLINSKKVSKLFSEYLYDGISSTTNVPVDDIQLACQNITNERLTGIITTETSSYALSTLLDNNAISVNYNAYIDTNSLDNFTSAVYARVLSNFCYLPYNSKLESIYSKLTANIILSDFTIQNTNSNELVNLNSYSAKYNVPKTFNSIIEANNIEQGITTFDNYSIHEQYLLSAEFSYRNQPQIKARPDTRYYYYREILVRDYFKFIENEYADYKEIYNNTSKYEIDNSYLTINSIEKVSLLSTENDVYILNTNMINDVAVILMQITNAIRDIREQLKTQVQKNFLKGTKLHLSYVIQEYIRANVYSMVEKLGLKITKYQPSAVIVNINEYTDSTEYFNLSTNVDSLSDNVNTRFWENNSTINAVGPFNDNNIFKKPTLINSSTPHSFTNNDISNFYLQILQTRFNTNLSNNNSDTEKEYEIDQVNHLNDFLCAVYDSGADTTYAQNDIISCNLDFNITNGLKISELAVFDQQNIIDNLNNVVSYINDNTDNAVNEINNTLINNILSDNVTIDTVSSITMYDYNNIIDTVNDILQKNNKTLEDIGVKTTVISSSDIIQRKYKTKLYKKYIGTDDGTYSFYNIKNQRHPSYQIHPYIKNFSETDQFEYPIKNIANITTEKLNDLIANNIDKYIDDDGYLQNIWNFPYNTNQDYISQYEKNSNINSLGYVQPHIGYDGLFYPNVFNNMFNTRNNLLLNSDEKLSTLSDFYSGLNLSKYELNTISAQLSAANDEIEYLLKNQTNIYRFGKDMYGNQYFLIKDGSDYGVLWMKYKDHPIALPMFVYTGKGDKLTFDESISQIKKTSALDKQSLIILNNKFINISSDDSIGIFSKSTTKRKTIGIKDFYISTDKSELIFVTKKHIIHTNIKKIFYNTTKYLGNKYYLTYDNNDLLEQDDCFYYNASDYRFKQFFNYETYPGIVLTKISDDKLNIQLQYWNKNKPVYNKINTQLSVACDISDKAQNTTIDDIYISITNQKRLSIAYLKQYSTQETTQETVRDKLEHTVTYPNNVIVTKDFRFDSRQIKELNSITNNYIHEYCYYNYMGFVPLHQGQNNIKSTKYDINLQRDGILKCNLIGNNSKADSGIFFKFVVPIRTHEQYNFTHDIKELSLQLSAVQLSAVNLSSVLYNELSSIEIKTPYDNIVLYDTHKFEQHLNNYNLTARLDESFISCLNSINSDVKADLDSYNNTPYIWIAGNNKTIESIPEIYTPGKNINNNIGNDTYVLCFSNDDELSVSWIASNKNIYGNGIKLDFNTAYYKGNKSITAQNGDNTNYFNYQHSFLNLDNPGDSGYLQIWKNNEKTHRYYIKNISDTQPKFLISIDDPKQIDNIDVGNNVKLSEEKELKFFITENSIFSKPIVIPFNN